jgi:hypothetical protein
MAAAPTALAVTLDSAPLPNVSGGQLVCRVVNVGTKEAIVTARLLNTTSGASIGTPFFENCNGEIPLQPGQACFVSLSGSIAARCNVVSNSSKIRAALVREVSGAPQAAVPVTK